MSGQNFPQFIVIHTVKGFGIVNKAEIDVCGISADKYIVTYFIHWNVKCTFYIQLLSLWGNLETFILKNNYGYTILAGKFYFQKLFFSTYMHMCANTNF